MFWLIAVWAFCGLAASGFFYAQAANDFGLRRPSRTQLMEAAWFSSVVGLTGPVALLFAAGIGAPAHGWKLPFTGAD